MSEYPILRQNKPIGTLRVTREGLHTVFSARAKTDAPRLRLAVCGVRSRAYLGLMLPDGSGALTLQKRLTRLECARLPQEILFAADEAWDIPSEPEPEPEPEPQRMPLFTARDLRNAFTLNDVFLFQRVLFHGSPSEFKNALEEITTLASADELREYLQSQHHINLKSDEARDFVGIVSSFFK